MTEYKKVRGVIGRGISSALMALLTYIVIPLSIAMLIAGVMDVALADLHSEGDVPEEIRNIVQDAETIMHTFMVLVITYGIPIVIIAFPLGLFGRGSIPHMIFGLVQVPLIMLWLFFITNGGVIPLEINDLVLVLGDDLPDIVLNATINIGLPGMTYLLMMLVLLKGAVYIADFGSYRGCYLRMKANLDEKESDQSKKKKQKKKKDNDYEFI
ncbi:MAG TPA: hypothetical protein HA366_01340 [Candidatus Methanomethylophilaceae archaeon]|nr:hypothetical protein [Candidatus Methanomethylophilaceae archaeon]